MTVDIENLVISKGSHDNPGDGMCAMEVVAHIAGEPHSDHPVCACPVIASFMRAWNDTLPHDLRQELIKPLLLKIVGSRGSADIQDRRAILVADWTQRVVLPLWMDLANLDTKQLRSLPEATTVAMINDVVRGEIVNDAKSRCAAARAAAGDVAGAAAGAVAWDVAGAAAWDVAGDAARAAAGAAARAAAGAAARAAAWDAARDAAGAAAWDVARAALKETMIAIWKTSPALIERLLSEHA